ncbi:MAG: hypothetical protein Q7V20_17155 [Aquabacterium sp.]|uniref:energy transducer TonB n=1 Tax=Aquabacterium sp. TaxID=1872578 RepID=UPI002721170A|nr:hypothetical protein [Aquabacterium sp.]MDO9005175.1 hypothetical protein [Aquabacterium sp.]
MPLTNNKQLMASGLVAVALHGLVLLWSRSGLDDEVSIRGLSGRSVQVRMVSQALVAEPVVEPTASPSASPPPQQDTAAPSVAPVADSAQAEQPTVDLEGYVPRRWLTVAPEPTAPILLPFPTSFQENARYTVVMNLFIEADGRVGRVEFVGIALPEVLEHAARGTFERARFTPGQVNGRIVKSLIRVEVDFDNLGQG